MRIALVHNPREVPVGKLDTSKESTQPIPTSIIIQTALETLSNPVAKNLLGKLLKYVSSTGNTGGVAGTGKSGGVAGTGNSGKVTGSTLEQVLVHGVDVQKFAKDMQTLGFEFLRVHQTFSRSVLKLKPGDRTVVSNGRVCFLI